MRKILVTAVSGTIGNDLVRIFTEAGDEVYACDVNKVVPSMNNVKAFYNVGYAVSEGYVESILKICEDNGIEYLIPSNEREIEVISANRKVFTDKGIKIIIQSEEVLSICLNKLKTAEFLRSIGVAAPKTYLSDEELKDDEKYIVKPCCSNGSKGLMIMTGAEIKKADFSSDYVRQEYIDSDEEYTLGVFRAGGITNTITFKRTLFNGASNVVDLSRDPEFRELAIKIADAFSLFGYFNIQLRKKDGKLYVFEINPRISGTVMFRHKLGFTDALWWMEAVDGNKVKPYECKYKRALGIRETREKYLVLEEE